MRRGEIWWAEMDDAAASEPGGRRPVLIVQADAFTSSRLGTVIVATLTTRLRRGEAPGNVLVPKRMARLPSDSVVNVSQVVTLDKEMLVARVGRLPASMMAEVDAGLRLALEL